MPPDADQPTPPPDGDAFARALSHRLRSLPLPMVSSADDLAATHLRAARLHAGRRRAGALAVLGSLTLVAIAVTAVLRIDDAAVDTVGPTAPAPNAPLVERQRSELPPRPALPSGWRWVDYDRVRLAVPASWDVRESSPCGWAVPTVDVGLSDPMLANCIRTLGTDAPRVQLLRTSREGQLSPDGQLPYEGPAAAQLAAEGPSSPSRTNGLAVRRGQLRDGSTRIDILALRMAVVLTNVQDDRVAETLTWSPLHGALVGPPASTDGWRTHVADGIAISVPAAWPVHDIDGSTTEAVGGCTLGVVAETVTVGVSTVTPRCRGGDLPPPSPHDGIFVRESEGAGIVGQHGSASEAVTEVIPEWPLSFVTYEIPRVGRPNVLVTIGVGEDPSVAAAIIDSLRRADGEPVPGSPDLDRLDLDRLTLPTQSEIRDGWRWIDVGGLRLAIREDWLIVEQDRCWEPADLPSGFVVLGGAELGEHEWCPGEPPRPIVQIERASTVPSRDTPRGRAEYLDVYRDDGWRIIPALGARFRATHTRDDAQAADIRYVIGSARPSRAFGALHGAVAPTKGWRNVRFENLEFLVPPRWEVAGPERALDPGRCGSAPVFGETAVLARAEWDARVPACPPPVGGPPAPLDGVWVRMVAEDEAAELRRGSGVVAIFGKLTVISTPGATGTAIDVVVATKTRDPLRLTVGVGEDPSIAAAILDSIRVTT